jgi:hypothetical protein
MPILTRKEVADLFSTSYFYENQLIYAIDPRTRTYQVDKNFSNLIDYAKFIRESYLSGLTIILKGLEVYSPQVALAAAKIGAGVNAHMYLTRSADSVSFDFHEDDRDVLIHMLYGEKVFELKRSDGVEKVIVDSEKPLFIPKGCFHRAQALGETGMISFGRENLAEYPIAGGLDVVDLGTNQ